MGKDFRTLPKENATAIEAGLWGEPMGVGKVVGKVVFVDSIFWCCWLLSPQKCCMYVNHNVRKKNGWIVFCFKSNLLLQNSEVPQSQRGVCFASAFELWCSLGMMGMCT